MPYGGAPQLSTVLWLVAPEEGVKDINKCIAFTFNTIHTN